MVWWMGTVKREALTVSRTAGAGGCMWVRCTKRNIILSVCLPLARFVIHVRRPGVIVLQSTHNMNHYLAIKNDRLTFVRRSLLHVKGTCMQACSSLHHQNVGLM